MPKMKTKSSAKKRFRVRPGGTVKRGQAFKRHILTKKTTKNKRHLRGAVNVHETNLGHVAQMMPFAGLEPTGRPRGERYASRQTWRHCTRTPQENPCPGQGLPRSPR
jgi:large subunit ribosomal protein L35